MILIACTNYASSLIEPLLLKELFQQNNLETFIYYLQTDPYKSNVIFTPLLIDQIKKAKLILLFVQPIPIADWLDPHDSFFTTIYSFIYSSPNTKIKTVYISPFLLDLFKDDGQGINFLKTLADRAKIGHFEIHPSKFSDFIDPPLLSYSSFYPINPLDLCQFYSELLDFCLNRIKKSK